MELNSSIAILNSIRESGWSCLSPLLIQIPFKRAVKQHKNSGNRSVGTNPHTPFSSKPYLHCNMLQEILRHITKNLLKMNLI